jgi:hypothetical protein
MMLPTLNVVAQEAHLEQTKKRSYRRNWENTFGKHTARCHPSSLVEVVRKEGKVILLLGSLGIIGKFVLIIIFSSFKYLHLIIIYKHPY